MIKRFALYSIVAFLLFMLVLPSFLLNPSRNLNSIAVSVKNNPSNKKHQSFSSYLWKFPDGFVLTFHTGNIQEFAPTEFVTITRVGNNTIIDLINGVGVENTVRLTGIESQEFIKKHHINLDYN